MGIRRFKMTDYPRIRLANGLGFERWGLPFGVIPTLRAMEQCPFWTVEDKDEIIAIGGFFPISSRVCEVSFLPSEQFVKTPKTTLKLLRSSLTGLCKDFVRVQMNCRNDARLVRFAEALGFKAEGIMRGFGCEGEDHLMMAIVREA